MSSSYSSLDLVLSHWPISLCIDLFVFILCVLVSYCEHGGVDLMGLKPNL